MQIVTPESEDDNQLCFCYHKDDEFVNRPLTIAPTADAAERTRVRRCLERDGVDVDVLEDDFITCQAIRTYLKEHRGAEYTPAETDPLEHEAASLQQLRGWTAAITEGKVEQLRQADQIVLDDFRTLVNIQVVCEGCNTQFDVVDLLDRGSCECAE